MTSPKGDDFADRLKQADLADRVKRAQAMARMADEQAVVVETQARNLRTKANSAERHYRDLLLELQGQMKLFEEES